MQLGTISIRCSTNTPSNKLYLESDVGFIDLYSNTGGEKLISIDLFYDKLAETWNAAEMY